MNKLFINKKFYLTVVLAIMILSLFACGQTGTSTNIQSSTTHKGTAGLEFAIEGNNATVTGYTGTVNKVIIPTYIVNNKKEYTVTKIAANAFKDDAKLVSIDIPATVTSIGAGAFRNCRTISEIVIPDGISVINEDTFNACAGLKTITIGSGVDLIKGTAFFDCHVDKAVFKKTIFWTLGSDGKTEKGLEYETFATDLINRCADEEKDLIRKDQIAINAFSDFMTVIKNGIAGVSSDFEEIATKKCLNLDVDVSMETDTTIKIPFITELLDLNVGTNIKANIQDSSTQIQFNLMQGDKSLLLLGYDKGMGYFSQHLIGEGSGIKMDFSMLSSILETELPQFLLGYLNKLVFKAEESLMTTITAIEQITGQIPDFDENLKKFVDISGDSQHMEMKISAETIGKVVYFLEGKDIKLFDGVGGAILNELLNTAKTTFLKGTFDSFNNIVTKVNNFLTNWQIKKNYFNSEFPEEVATFDFLVEYIIPDIDLEIMLNSDHMFKGASVLLDFATFTFKDGGSTPVKNKQEPVSIRLNGNINSLSTENKELEFDVEQSAMSEDIVINGQLTLSNKEVLDIIGEIYTGDLFSEKEEGTPIVGVKVKYNGQQYKVFTFDGQVLKFSMGQLLNDLGVMTLEDPSVEDRQLTLNKNIVAVIIEGVENLFGRLIDVSSITGAKNADDEQVITSNIGSTIESLITKIIASLSHTADITQFNFYGFIYNFFARTILDESEYQDATSDTILDSLKQESVAKYINFMNGDEENFRDILDSIIEKYNMKDQYEAFSGLIRSSDGTKGLLPFISEFIKLPYISYEDNRYRVKPEDDRTLEINDVSTITNYTYWLIKMIFGDNIECDNMIRKIYGSSLDVVYDNGIRMDFSQSNTSNHEYTFTLSGVENEKELLKLKINYEYKNIDVNERIKIE
ncbi:MAG: leucine-rich repeat domain-containing protein [Clostridia bacterium]|nr:leucine-rich repeat domain-containing protein [Clostridia bacterium]